MITTKMFVILYVFDTLNFDHFWVHCNVQTPFY